MRSCLEAETQSRKGAILRQGWLARCWQMPWESMKPAAQTGAASRTDVLVLQVLVWPDTTEVNGPLYRPDLKLTGVRVLTRPDGVTAPS
jgi:hypothetical protein